MCLGLLKADLPCSRPSNLWPSGKSTVCLFWTQLVNSRLRSASPSWPSIWRSSLTSTYLQKSWRITWHTSIRIFNYFLLNQHSISYININHIIHVPNSWIIRLPAHSKTVGELKLGYKPNIVSLWFCIIISIPLHEFITHDFPYLDCCQGYSKSSWSIRVDPRQKCQWPARVERERPCHWYESIVLGIYKHILTYSLEI